jgi:hypothetical protein
MADNDYMNHELLQPQQSEAPPPEPAQVTEDQNDRPRDERGRFASEAESEAPDAPEAVEASEEDETTAQEAESDEPESEEPEERSQRRRSARERISQLTAQKKEAEARAEQAEREVHELREYLQQQVDPNLEFEDPARFQQETVRRALAEQRANDSLIAYQRSQQARLESNQQMFLERLESMRDELPDFDAVFTPQTPVSEHAVEFLAESEIGPKIAHHLGKNPSLAARIAALPPAKQGVELARIEAKLMTPPPKRTTKAPAPAKPIAATGPSGTFDPQRSGVEDFKRMIYGSKG